MTDQAAEWVGADPLANPAPGRQGIIPSAPSARSGKSKLPMASFSDLVSGLFAEPGITPNVTPRQG